MLNRISHTSKWLLVLGVCSAFSPSLHADGIYISEHFTDEQVYRPLNGTVRVDFQIQLSMSSNYAFERISVTPLYNAHGDMIQLVVPDWSIKDFPKGVGTESLFWALIDKDTPLGLYNSSSPTSHQPAIFTAYALNPTAEPHDEASVSISFSLDIEPNPLAVPEPCSALLLCLGAMAPLGRFALRRHRCRS
ncbi:MAG: hypothetical protein P4L85_24505 [Paludisphaera borealis]|uniref:hypothetical protein n=1 Tax=Paludisphaera borealis TaxID=1387353 RepID=UPI00284E5707|nr:hypothetical protein [Paludisphaera borealis]MDR3622536.1 hypothetical protein [Paludisphaera borealis]